MESWSKQQFRAITERNGWSVDYAEGYRQGQHSRRNGAKLSSYAMAGLDDYCLGFRAGYFGRHQVATMCVERAWSASQPNWINSSPRVDDVTDAC